MFQLIYTSTLAEDVTESDLETLVSEARHANEAAQVTGVMILGDRRLLQLLEGQENAVRTLFRRIIQDRRHESCELLLVRNMAERSFAQWSMGFCRTGDEDYKLKIVIAELRTHRDDKDRAERRATQPTP